MKLKARSLFTMADVDPLIENVTIRRNDRGVLHISSGTHLESSIEKKRMILPFLVNAHTHLELSVYFEKIQKNIAFIPWLMELNDLRNKTHPDDIKTAMQNSLKATWNHGTGIIIDICNDLTLWRNITDVNEQQTIFIYNELLGFDPLKAEKLLAAGKMNIEEMHQNCDRPVRLTPHALYSTSARLCSGIRNDSPYPISMHIAEHNAEIEMFNSRSGPLVDFMNSIGVWDEEWKPSQKSILNYAVENHLIGEGDLAVHLVKTNTDDLQLISENRILPCLCPRSNDYYNNGQPPVAEMLSMGMKPLLGTDSLASNSSLNMIDEIRFAMNTWEEVLPLCILEMATLNIKQFAPFKNLTKFFPIISGKNQPFIELIFENEIVNPFKSLKFDRILEQNIHV